MLRAYHEKITDLRSQINWLGQEVQTLALKRQVKHFKQGVRNLRRDLAETRVKKPAVDPEPIPLDLLDGDSKNGEDIHELLVGPLEYKYWSDHLDEHPSLDFNPTDAQMLIADPIAMILTHGVPPNSSTIEKHQIMMMIDGVPKSSKSNCGIIIKLSKNFTKLEVKIVVQHKFRDPSDSDNGE